MQELSNPKMGIESFDAIYASALQVVIVAGANGVCVCDLFKFVCNAQNF